MANGNKRKSFFEDFLKIRVEGKPGKEYAIGVVSDKDSLGNQIENAVENGNYVDIATLEQFRTLGTDRNSQYRMYDEMAYDSILSAALEIYTDESTQYNTDGKIIWVESDDPNVAKFGNHILEVLQVNDHTWSYIYNLVKYGDIYLQLYSDSDILDDPLVKRVQTTDIDVVKDRKGATLEDYMDMVANPARMFDISQRGKTDGFIEGDLPDNSDQGPKIGSYQLNMNDNNLKIHDPKKFVHIMLCENSDRFPETMELTFGDSEDMKTVSYNVKRGKSIMHDLYKIYREIQLMEDSLLLNRVTRSSIIRLLQIEVGDMPKNQVDELLRRFKRLVEQKNFMDKGEGSFTSAANPGPIDNVLYVPTRDGKGAVSASNLGGDVDVKAISDVDYFKKKEYGALKIPRQYLGETDEGGGFSGGTSLSKLDSRFARTIKRIQNAYIAGITTLINLYALDRGWTEYINNFTVKMTSPATTEDSERDEQLSQRLEIVDRLLSLLPENEMIDPKTKKQIVVDLLSGYLGEAEIAELVQEDKFLKQSEKEEQDDLGMEDSDIGGRPGRSGGMSPRPMGGGDINIDVNNETPTNEPGGMEELGGTEELGIREPEIDFSEIEI